MPDGTVTFAKEVWDLIKYVILATLGLFGWHLKRARTQLDEHERNHVKKSDFNDTLNSLRADIKDGFSTLKTDVKDMHKETNDDIRDIHKRINGVGK